MTEEEKKYREDLKANGVEVPEEEVTPEQKADADAKAKEKADAKAKADEEAKAEKEAEEDTDFKTEPKEPRKRSIYDEYKDKKVELKSEREKREQAERERDELRSKLDALEKAETPEEKQDAQDDLEKFAQEINADPKALRKMRELFNKDLKPSSDPDLAKRLERFEKWEAQNKEVSEKQAFESEFHDAVPALKELFPKINEEELKAMKNEIEKLAHKKEWHDKDIDYIAFKNQKTLQTLVSPKKRGMETRERKDVSDTTFEFDMNADLSKMSPKERDAWEAEYRKMGKSDTLITDSQGKKLIV